MQQMDISQAKEIGDFIKSLVSSGGTFLIGLAALIGVFRVNKLIKLFSKVSEARTSIFDLVGTARKLDDQLPSLQAEVTRISELGLAKRLDDLAIAIKDAGASINGLSKRLTEQERQLQMPTPPASASASVVGPMNLPLEAPWERLSDVWYEATGWLEQRIEERLEKGAHHKTVEKYGRVSRHSYATLIDLAFADGYIDAHAQSALTDINQLFLKWRPRNAGTPAEVAAQAQVLLAKLNGRLPPVKE
jgi:hypothetical protein